MNKNYLIIIGDIIDSKKIRDREKVQNQLRIAFSKLNKQLKDIISPFTITLGDEFQVVLGNSKDIFQILLTISEAIFPYNIRYSLSIGRISTKINRKNAIGMDGPAFHTARKGVETLKINKSVFSLKTESKQYDLLISASMNIIFYEIYKYKSTNRAELFVKTLMGIKKDKVAEVHGVSRQNISKNIKRWQIEQKIVVMREFEKLMSKEL